MKALLLILVVCGILSAVRAQIVEDWIESSENPEELKAWLDQLREHPLDLNHATLADLEDLPFFEYQRIQFLLQERDALGGFSNINQVLALDFLTEPQRQSLRLFTKVNRTEIIKSKVRIHSICGGSKDQRASIKSRDLYSKSQTSFVSYDKTKGFVFGFRRSGTTDFFNGVSAGIEFPAHDKFPRILIGDYQNDAGTGLVFASAYGIGNWLSSLVKMEPGNSDGLVSRPTTNGRLQYRGFALYTKFPLSQLSFLYSNRYLDAQLNEANEIEQIVEGTTASPDLLKARKDQVHESLFGVVGETGFPTIRLGVTAYRAQYSPAFAPASTSSELTAFQGNHLDLGSVYLKGSFKEISGLAEIAKSRQGGGAFQSQLSFGNRQLRSTIYHVYASEDFFSPHSMLWGGYSEEAANAQTTGIRLCSSWRSHSLYLIGQTEKTPYRTSTSSLSKSANSIEIKWHFIPSEKIDLDLAGSRRFREETSLEQPTRDLRQDKCRFEASFHGTAEEYKIRFEIRSARDLDTKTSSTGTLLYLQVNAPVLSINAFTRITFFNAPSYDVRMTTYENSLQGSYPLVPLYGTGRRVSLILSKKWSQLSAGLKLSHTALTENMEDHESLDFAATFGFYR